MNRGACLEYKRICYRRSFNVYRVMLKGDRMKHIKGEIEAMEKIKRGRESQSREKYCGKCGEFICRCRDSQGRYQPAKIEVKTYRADQRYYKLANGDILDMESKTIINRGLLQALLNS